MVLKSKQCVLTGLLLSLGLASQALSAQAKTRPVVSARAVSPQQISKQQAASRLSLVPDVLPTDATAALQQMTRVQQVLGLDLGVVLTAVVQKDYAPDRQHKQRQQRLQRGWAESFLPDALDHHFDTVFHAWCYAEGHPALTADQRQHVAALREQIRARLQSLHMNADQASGGPILRPFSAQPLNYQVDLSRFSPPLSPEQKQLYRHLYRASASQAEPLQHESWALETLFERPGSALAATQVWRYLGEQQKQMGVAQAFQAGIQQVEAQLQASLDNGEFESEYLKVINWDTGFRPDQLFFLSADYTTTALYGSVIFLVEQAELRGLPLNVYGQDQGFYRQLPYRWLLSEKGFWIFAVADRAEYVVPAAIQHGEIYGVDVRGPRQLQREGMRTGAPGQLLRKYRKYQSKQGLQVYIFDAQDRWMGTLNTAKEFMPCPGFCSQTSLERLPSEVQKILPAGVIYHAPE